MATNNGRWQKGQSGNPTGRPKVVAVVQQYAREHTEEAIDTLVTIMRNTKAPAAARALASNSILDRGYGKPAQTIDASLNRRAPEEMTDEELLAIAAGAKDEEPTDRSLN
jgi:hypothetical protein